MTTYGTISSELPESPDFIVRAREQIRSGLGTRRSWKEMIQIQSISLPSTFNDAMQRIRTNAAFFRMNYTIIILFLLFLSLLWHPISLIVFIITMVAWSFLYFSRDEPVKLLGLAIDDRIVMMALLLATLAALFITGVTDNIMGSLSIGAVVFWVHAVLRSTDDLVFAAMDEEGFGAAPSSLSDAPPSLQLEHAASSSYAMS